MVIDLPANDLAVYAFTPSGGESLKAQTPFVRTVEKRSLSDAFAIIQSSGSLNSDQTWLYRTATGSGGYLYEKTTIQEVIKQKSTDISTLLESIKSTFALTDESLARALGSVRKTVHNWDKGGKPNKSKLKRILELNNIAEAWRDANFPQDKNTMSVAIFDELSVVDLLTQKSLDKEAILFAGSSLALDALKDAPELKDPFA